MKAIHVDPKEIKNIFSDTYVIPDFQRPYSCERHNAKNYGNILFEFFEVI